jgi:hypothetical protein
VQKSAVKTDAAISTPSNGQMTMKAMVLITTEETCRRHDLVSTELPIEEGTNEVH